MKTNFLKILLLTALIGSGSAAQCRATVLIFEPSNDLAFVPTNYGHRVTRSPDAFGNRYGLLSGATSNVVVEYGPPGSSVLEGPAGYGNLPGVAYQEDGDFGVLEVTLKADAGFFVALEAFDLAALGGDTLVNAVQVVNENQTELFGRTDVIVAGDGPNHTRFALAPPLVSGALTIRVDVRNLGNTESHFIGIDNVQFSQRPSGACSLPAPRLLITRSGAGFQINWSGAGYCLQTTPALANPPSATIWATIPGASPIAVPAGPGMKFFRLVCPCP